MYDSTYLYPNRKDYTLDRPLHINIVRKLVIWDKYVYMLAFTIVIPSGYLGTGLIMVIWAEVSLGQAEECE